MAFACKKFRFFFTVDMECPLRVWYNRGIMKRFFSVIAALFLLFTGIACTKGPHTPPIEEPDTTMKITDFAGTDLKGYHISPRKGWLNDPNGLIYYKGIYHVFFQYYPTLPAARDKLWGHMVSDDLLHWKELTPALTPDTVNDDWGIWSGSAIEKDGQMYLFYTGLRSSGAGTAYEVPGHGQFGQCLATSTDGISFKKSALNPLIPLFPPANGDPTFRDPSVSYYNGTYYMMCASKNGLLYKSDDLLSWTYVGVPYQTGGIECPDFKPYGDKYLYIFSQGTLGDVNTTVKFAYGAFDGQAFTPEIMAGPEKGPFFYAPQTMIDAKGRHILLAWMYEFVDGHAVGNGSHENPGVDGALTIPREITVKDGKIYSYPVEEYRHLLKDGDADVIVTDTTVTLNVPRAKQPSFTAEKITDVKIFREGNCLEVFINGGEAVFTYLF
jgi:beta-fructofuranosidase